MNKLNPKAFGLALGLLWGGGVVFMGLTAMVCSWAQPFVDVLAVLYRGYTATLIGNVIGFAWGFIDGFIGGFLLAWLYNKLSK